MASGAIETDMLCGAWSLHFGMFGCGGDRMRGSFVQIEQGRLSGGDAVFIYEGRWIHSGDELRASLDIRRHRRDAGVTTLFGTAEQHYRVQCSARLITRDLIEGRIGRPGFSDARLVMCRLPYRKLPTTVATDRP